MGLSINATAISVSLLLSPIATAAAENGETARAIRDVLDRQTDAWNAGDILKFVDYYWRSDELTFSSAGTTLRGWTATLERYRDRYPSKEQMGEVTFSNLEITPLGDAAAFVLGKWHLRRKADPIQGNFTLIFRKFEDRWLIVHDHTSRLAEDERK